jgi:DNA-binding transcriptional ArsR family regulator
MASKAKGKKGKANVAKTGPRDRVPRSRVKKRTDLEPIDDRLMKALSHPLRIQILTLVNNRPWSPNEIHKELDEGLSQVSYHVRVLFKTFKMIELVKTEPRRGAVEHYYKAVDRVFAREEIAARLPESARLMLRDRIIEDADRDIQEALAAGTFYQRKDVHADWIPMDLDDQAFKAISTRADKFIEEAIKIAGAAAARIADGAEPIPMSLALFGFVSARKPGEDSPAADGSNG